MAQRAGHSDPAAAAAKAGQAQTEAMLTVQKDLLDTYEEISRAWLARVKSEADLWSELASKVSGARSVPDALGAYQQSVAQRMQMAADDGRRVFDDSQKIMGTIAKSLSNKWPSGST
jgi:Phasin protein